MPGLHHEAVACPHVGKHQHVVPAVGLALAAHHLAHRRHPAAEHAFFAALDQRFLAQFGEGMFRTRGAAATVGEDGHGVQAFACAHKGGPRPAAAVVLGVEQGGRRRRGIAHLCLVRVAVAQQAVGQQVGFGHCHLRQRQPEIRRAPGRIGRLGAFVQAQHAAVGAQRELALRVVQMLIDRPMPLQVGEAAQRAADMRGRRQRFQTGQRRRRQRACSRRRGQRGTCTDRRGGRHAPTQKGSTVHRYSLE
ncbi:UNVERIFIED_ORG: hypothetical protein ABIB63_000094 [Xanthomonas axonopodis]